MYAKRAEDLKDRPCKMCGKPLNTKEPRVFCSIECTGKSKGGVARKDCRVYRRCQICNQDGFGIGWWNACRKMCRACAIRTPRRYPKENHKNRKYKRCECGVTGYGIEIFPHDAKGKCRECWAAKTGYAIKIKVSDEWDKWANTKGSEFFRKGKRRTCWDGWEMWIRNKQVILINRRRIQARENTRARVIPADWDTCIDGQLYKLRQQGRYLERDQWDMKCSRWMTSLKARQRIGQHQEPS